MIVPSQFLKTMTEPEEYDEMPQPRHRSGWRWLFKRALVVVVILALVAFLARWQVGRIGQRQLDAMTAHLDATDPGWRLPEIEAARTQAAPPDDKNPARKIVDLYKSFPPEWNNYLGARSWDWGPVTNYRPSFFEFVWIVGGQEMTKKARDSLREELLRPEVLATPSGHYVLIHNENPLMTLLPDTQKARSVAAMLNYDAWVSVMEKKENRAIGSARGCLVVAKSIGEEPYLVSQLVRLACSRIAVQTALQVLALSEPKEGLAELQKELRSEADVPWLQYGFRGERGMVNKLFDGLQTGKIEMSTLEGISNQKSILHAATLRAYKPLLPGDQAKALEILTAFLEASKLPPHEQKAAFAEIKLPPRPPEDIRYLVTNLIVPAGQKVAEAAWRTRADLLTGSAAIACERYRIANGRWPDSLSDIPRDILQDIPIDPFNGKPIQYQKLDDGVAIFSIGDEQEAKRRNSGEIKDPIGHLGRGWKLWNKELRKIQPPLPLAEPGVAK
jgi:hypothetical protein